MLELESCAIKSLFSERLLQSEFTENISLCLSDSDDCSDELSIENLMEDEQINTVWRLK